MAAFDDTRSTRALRDLYRQLLSDQAPGYTPGTVDGDFEAPNQVYSTEPSLIEEPPAQVYADGGAVETLGGPDYEDYGSGRFTRTPAERREVRERRIAQWQPPTAETDPLMAEWERFGRTHRYSPLLYGFEALGRLDSAGRDRDSIQDIKDLLYPGFYEKSGRLSDAFVDAASLASLGLAGKLGIATGLAAPVAYDIGKEIAGSLWGKAPGHADGGAVDFEAADVRSDLERRHQMRRARAQQAHIGDWIAEDRRTFFENPVLWSERQEPDYQLDRSRHFLRGALGALSPLAAPFGVHSPQVTRAIEAAVPTKYTTSSDAADWGSMLTDPLNWVPGAVFTKLGRAALRAPKAAGRLGLGAHEFPSTSGDFDPGTFSDARDLPLPSGDAAHPWASAQYPGFLANRPYRKGGVVSEALRKVRDRFGSFQGDRLEQAADLTNLERFSEKSLLDLMDPAQRNSGLLMAMPPGDFQNYAKRLPEGVEGIVPYPRWDNIPRARARRYAPREHNLENYMSEMVDFVDRKGLGEPSRLWLYRTLDPLTAVEGHEGRHRMMALDRLGEDRGLVNLLPANAGELRGEIEERIARLKQKYFPRGAGQLVVPEQGGTPLPIYHEPFDRGGAVSSRIGNALRDVVQRYGAEQGRRLEQAADRANLDRFSEEALYETFGPQSKYGAYAVIPPSQFERYARPLDDKAVHEDILGRYDDSNSFHEYIARLGRIAQDTGLSDVPFLRLTRDRSDSPIARISQHEGRHRMRALDALGDDSALLRIEPRDVEGDPLSTVRRLLGPYPAVHPEGYGEASIVGFPFEPFDRGGAVRRLAKTLKRELFPDSNPRLDGYLRFGEWPENERSAIHIEPGFERGVSVYPLHVGESGVQPEVPVGGPITDLWDRLEGDVPRFIVEGRRVGRGYDMEPVLRDVRKLGPYHKSEGLYDLDPSVVDPSYWPGNDKPLPLQPFSDFGDQFADGGLVRRAANAIRMYHGSGRKFDKFDSEWINSGGGIHEYPRGYGLYFTEDPTYASWYHEFGGKEPGTYDVSLFHEPKNLIDLDNIFQDVPRMKDRMRLAGSRDTWRGFDWDGANGLEALEHLEDAYGPEEAARRLANKGGFTGTTYQNEFANSSQNVVTFPGFDDLIQIERRYEPSDAGALLPHENPSIYLDAHSYADGGAVRFLKNMREHLGRDKSAALDKIGKVTGATKNEALIYGTPGTDDPLSAVVRGDATSVTLPDWEHRFVSAAHREGRPWFSAHTHPNDTLSPSYGDLFVWGRYPDHPQDMLISAWPSGAALELGSLARALPRGDIDERVALGNRILASKRAMDGRSPPEALRHYRGLLDFAGSHGLDIPKGRPLGRLFTELEAAPQLDFMARQGVPVSMDARSVIPNTGGALASDVYPELMKYYRGAGREHAPFDLDGFQSGGVVSKARLRALNSPAFREWFGGSRVLDANGDPLVTYHATDVQKPIDRFRTPSYFASDPDFAARFARDTPSVYPSFLRLENPYRVDSNVSGRHFEWDRRDIADMRREGFDGVHVFDANDPSADIFTTFDPLQVRSLLDKRWAPFQSGGAVAAERLAAKSWKTRRATALQKEVEELNAGRDPTKEPFISPEVMPRLQTVQEPRRIMFPGIYKDPRDIIDEARGKWIADPGEAGAMFRLFGHTRNSLDELSQGNRYLDAIEPPTTPWSPPDGGKGARISDQVLTNRNASRVQDVLGLALEDPQLRTTRSWYEMSPLWDWMTNAGLGPKMQRGLNARMGVMSPGSDPPKEINRGFFAHYLSPQGRIEELAQYGTLPMARRPDHFPDDLSGLIPHPYTNTAHMPNLRRFEATGDLSGGEKHKVATYVMASDPLWQYGDRPVADAHFTRFLGYPDVRTSRTWGSNRKDMTTSEYADVLPWWRRKVAIPLDMRDRDAQALMWNVGGPQTGVSYIGPPKLEMIANHIEAASRRLGLPLEETAYQMLSGQSPGFAHGGAVDDMEPGYVTMFYNSGGSVDAAPTGYFRGRDING